MSILWRRITGETVVSLSLRSTEFMFISFRNPLESSLPAAYAASTIAAILSQYQTNPAYGGRQTRSLFCVCLGTWWNWRIVLQMHSAVSSIRSASFCPRYANNKDLSQTDNKH